jgi:hypothetical protein
MAAPYRGPVPHQPCSPDGCLRPVCGHGPPDGEILAAQLVVPCGKRLLTFPRFVTLEGCVLDMVGTSRESIVREIYERVEKEYYSTTDEPSSDGGRTA